MKVLWYKTNKTPISTKYMISQHNPIVNTFFQKTQYPVQTTKAGLQIAAGAACYSKISTDTVGEGLDPPFAKGAVAYNKNKDRTTKS